jgi:AraC-like DNA-binding protein
MAPSYGGHKSCKDPRYSQTHGNRVSDVLSTAGILPLHADTASGLSRHSLSLPAPIGASLQQLMHQLLVQNLHRGLTLKELSQFIGYSEKYCSEWFVARMGRSFSRYVKELRLERATVMLQSRGRLADIAERLGFQDQYAFSHFFKKATGLSPSTFREQCAIALETRCANQACSALARRQVTQHIPIMTDWINRRTAGGDNPGTTLQKNLFLSRHSSIL